MKASSWIIMFTGLALATGCASTPPVVPESNLPNPLPETGVAAVPTDDADGDSIVDTDDLCADTDEQALVDNTGCEVRMGAVDGLVFQTSQVALTDSTEKVLDRYVDVLNRYPVISVSIEGHTDNRGPAAANLELSKERVLSVVRYMIGNGINPDRLKPFGYGESRPRAANATSEGREQNRRIEIKVIDGLL